MNCIGTDSTLAISKIIARFAYYNMFGDRQFCLIAWANDCLFVKYFVK